MSWFTRLGPVTIVALFVGGCGGGGGGGGDGPPASSFTVTGGILASSGSVVDSDVNDPNAPYASNDHIETAQSIPNPTSVGGYVNRPGTGHEGRSFATGDILDFYHVSLVAGQTIQLLISDPEAGDLDLILLDPDGRFRDISESTTGVEALVAPETGAFLVVVEAYEGASSYLLTIGQETLPTASDRLSVLDDFVPGEIVARFDEAFTQKGGDGAEASLAARTVGATAIAGSLDREVLLTIEPDDVRLVAADTRADGATRTVVEWTRAGIRLPADLDPAKFATITAIKRLRSRMDVLYAEPNYILRTNLTPNDQHYPLQWHYHMIGLPQAWNITTGSSEVVVAVVDSGILSAHPDIQGSLVPGYDFVSNPEAAFDGDGIDPDPEEPLDPDGGSPAFFHGTHVAGTIGAASNNGSGVAGVNWSVSIMPLRAIGVGGSGTSYDVSQAIRYAARLSNDSGMLPPRRADVINLSLGGSGYSQTTQNLMNSVRAQGVIVVAAAGNENSSAPSYPAAYAGVVSVSAVDINRGKAPYSNFGSTIDVAAPGGRLSTDVNGDGHPDGVLSTSGAESSGVVRPVYAFLQGTSMASPHVAGVAALMKAVNPALTPAMFDSLLAGGQLTRDLGAPGRDDVYGHGLIDAYAAVVAAGGMPGAANLIATPGSLNFGTSTTSLSLVIENAGGSSVTANAPVDDASWLTVTAVDTDANGLGRYTVSISRSGLFAGTYTATITVTSSANTVLVPVIMQVSSTVLSGDVGHQYVVMVDAETGDSVYQYRADAVNGRYSYQFNRVEPGEYLVFSGSDNDNDGMICDAGESCGAHLTLEQPVVLDLSANRTLPDFVVNYVSGISAQAAVPGNGAGIPYRRLDEEEPLRRIVR